MRLSDSENQSLILTQKALFNHVIETTQIVESKELGGQYSDIDLEDFWKLTQYIFAHPDIIDNFVRENPAQLDQEWLDLASSWKRFVHGRFAVLKDLKNYSVFMEMKEFPKLYGVVGLFKEIKDMSPCAYPMLIDTYLIPFHEKIVHCGFFRSFQVSFGLGMRKSLLEEYRQSKQRQGIITRL